MSAHDLMRQHIDYIPEVTDDVREKARRAVALAVPKEEVADLLDMLGIR